MMSNLNSWVDTNILILRVGRKPAWNFGTLGTGAAGQVQQNRYLFRSPISHYSNLPLIHRSGSHGKTS
jgi:hypothetical protein